MRVKCLFIGFVIMLVSCKNNNSDYTGIPKKKTPKIVDYNFDVRPILSDKCFNCHGPDANKRSGDLRLDIEEGALKALKDNPNKHAIVKGKPDESEVYLRIMSKDSTIQMPPAESHLELTEYEIKIIKKWIKQGAEYQPHWAFIPPSKPTLPEVKNEFWVKNEIDYFTLDKIEGIGLEPNSVAEKERLLKRVSFDLTGLPPTIELQNQFINDSSEKAYENLIDTLLSRKQYGEKMAVHWLDVARYADSHGYQDDGPRTMWPWRDWVIHAFNKNYPYDKFIRLQLAGDLLPKKTIETVLATGFNRNHKITQEGGVIDEEYRVEYVTDRTNTFGKAFLGLTFECAKCHDHKYDPISQREYYQTFAFFDKVPEKGFFGAIQKGSLADPPFIQITDKMVKNQLPFINKKNSDDVRVMVMKDSADIRTTHILDRGVYDGKTEIVDFSLPKAILEFDTSKFDKNRLGLVEWLLDEENPLTSRVFVNRIWQEFFGKGIINTSGDFGMQGDLPSHSKLLDWLAVDFKENGWDIKRLIKQIVTSATYTQSTVVDSKKLEADPENIYLSRMNRMRLNAEMIRDHVLASSGLLNKEIGGPSVRPYQPDKLWSTASSSRGLLSRYVQDHGHKLYRRGLYTFIKRTVLPPVQTTFDAAARDQCEVKRHSTSTPLQALIMLNGPTVLESARVLSEKLNDDNSSLEEKIKKAFKRIVCREIRTEEMGILLNYYQVQKDLFKQEPENAEKFIEVGEHPIKKHRNVIEVASLMQIIHTLYNMEETIIKS
ncbi:PSD1 and planctomycete cytochrome C domain-containing protein [Tamlana sp. 2201CG12-4]|uniref:PSD1 and planctomycete cytochrome C domain-containing protein n=1 Tax=Tamlana sp. 2201CG12-4 TaxID=3112582 RepID=UPI002DBBC213|nr:PSD1 and planctomycete cytochrome C domain-containing protein [Tamlana sp. 2201CG12-4]MEC3906545.1 PSD1 and planctomycete cytochrome C domain-containing protein [Tamlana sp. 2201CG12-4]